MAFKTAHNTFNKGMNKDMDQRVQDNSSYVDAKNISIMGDGKFMSAKNMAGTKELEEIIPVGFSDVNILGAFECVGTYYSYGGEERNPSILIFSSYNDGASQIDEIKLYDIKKDKSHLLLKTDFNTSSIEEKLDFPTEGTIDAVIFGEKNFDKIYFDDDKNPLRSFEITDKEIPNARSLTARPLAPVDNIKYIRQIDGSGENTSGTYQFSYRYYNIDTKKYSSWSLLTLPIPVYPIGYQDVVSLDQIFGGVPNESTKKSIVLSIEKTAENSINYDAIQLAVIKNTDGSKQPSTIAYLTPVRKCWFDNPSEIIYDGQGLETAVDSQEIVTEDSSVISAKTLTSKDGVLFRGNVQYDDLTVGDITISNANTITKKIGPAGTRFSPTNPNDNNPQFNNINGSQFGLKVEDGAGQEIASRYVMGYNSFLDIRNQRGGVGNFLSIGRAVGDEVFGEVKDTDVSFTIPDNIVPGNEVYFNIGADRFGMRQFVGDVVGYSDEFGFNINTLEKINATGVFDESWTQTAINNLASLFGLIGGGNDKEEDYRTLVSDYRYIVQQNDTPESVARNIEEQILSRINSYSSAIRMERDGSTLNFFAQDEQFTYNLSGNEVTNPTIQTEAFWRPLIFVEYAISNGINISTEDDEGELKSLREEDDSIFGGYKNPYNAHNFKGHFRDEVYRYGVTYMNKYGNWSRPTPIDFSNFNVFRETQETFIVRSIKPITFEDNVTSTGLTAMRLETSSHGFEVGDLLKSEVKDGVFEFAEIRRIKDDIIIVGGDLTIDIGFQPTVTKLIGGEYSWASEGTDWKFPSRKNSKFPMLSSIDEDGGFDQNNTFINPLGLRIEGLTGHPEWAVAVAVVRVKRLKNILWQSPAITTQAVMPSLYEEGEQPFCETPIAGSSPLGTYGPKSFSKGVSFHIDRLNESIGLTNSFTTRRRIMDEEEHIPNLVTVVPPEYMYQNDGINIGSGLTLSGATIEIVDAVSFFRTWEFDVDGSGADDGDSISDQLGLAIRADNAFNYYYKDVTGFFDLSTYPYENGGGNRFSAGQGPSGGKTKALFYGEIVNQGESVALPAPPVEYDFRLKSISNYGNLSSVSQYNCGTTVKLQKSICILTDKKFGDFSYFSRQSDSFLEFQGVPIGRDDINFANESLKVGGSNLFGSDKFNVGKSAFSISDSSVTDNKFLTSNRSSSLRITKLQDGAVSSAPIVNLVRGISDDRYGKIDDVNQYIHTGAYSKISSTDDVIDFDVWGGDCFITKHVAKISDSHVDQTLLNPVSGLTRTFAYDDFQEIMMVYLESTINCELQAGQFHYPIMQRQSLEVFRNEYSYPYNPGYSVENELKIWVNQAVDEDDRQDFPARIIYSDQKVFQTNVEGFDRYRVNSFYDMPEEFNSITKLIKLANDNVYVIQEESVSVLPINKNIVEDSNGGQLLVNSSTLINTPNFLLNKNGSQHIRSIKSSETHIFFVDARRREVFKIGGGGSDGKISDIGMHSEFFKLLDSNCGIPEHKMVSSYDFNNNEYWIGINSYLDKPYINNVSIEEEAKGAVHYVWSDKLNAWMTECSVSSSTEVKSLVYSHSSYFMLGSHTDGSVKLEEMYSGETYGRMLGEDNLSSIKFVVNPDEPFGKTFDVLRLDSTNPLDKAIAKVYREEPLDPLTTEIDLKRKSRHDSFEVPMLLAQGNQRIRGKVCEIELFMYNGNDIQIDLMNVLTKYRLSGRIFR